MSVTVTSFGDLPKAIKEGNTKALLELVTRVTAQAKSLAPVDTAELKNSIMGQVKGGDYGHQGGPKINESPKTGEGYVGSAVAHGIYNEFGTRKMQAQPWLRPAIAAEASGAKVSKVVKDLQVEAVKKGMAKGPRKKKVVR